MPPFVVLLLVLCLATVIGVSIWAQHTFLREIRGLRERVAELEVRVRHGDEDRGRLQEQVRDVERQFLRYHDQLGRVLLRSLDEGVRELEQPPSVETPSAAEKPPPSLYERIGKDEDDP